MKFTHEAWLYAGAFAGIVLIWVWRHYDARQQRALARFVASHLRLRMTQSVSPLAKWTQRGLLWLALMCLFIALAGPLYGFRWEQISRRGNEIVFAIDTSRSMSAPDVKPSRLIRAKLAMDDMARQLGGDALGIVAFAGTAFLTCPITLDYEAFHESLGAIDTNTIPRGGTNISSAIAEAQLALHRRQGSDKILILVTDGEDLEGSAVDAATAAFKDDGLKIFTVGVGTPNGELIPIPPEQGGGFVKDENGQPVKSRLDEPALKAIAAATGGRYVPLGVHGEGLEELSKTVLGSLAKHDLAFRQQKIYTERYQWPLAASLCFLLASLMTGTRRWGRRALAPQAAMLSGLALLMALAVPQSRAADVPGGATPGVPTPGVPTPDVAAAPATDIKAPVRQYNAGTAAYRAGDFSHATQAFQQSIRQMPSSDPKRLADQEDAYYNLGNALYRAGQKTAQSAPQDTLKTWTDAVKAYETALQLRADDADSKFNRDLVKRKIAELNNKPPPPQNQGGGGGGGAGGGGDGGGGDKGQPPPGQPPPPGQQAPPAQSAPGQPPAGAGQSPPTQPKPADSKPGSPPSPQPAKPQASAEGESDDAQGDAPQAPGEMSREEARELLDSAKSDERHARGAPLTRQSADQPPDKPFKNW